jgi:hypothetical protein
MPSRDLRGQASATLRADHRQQLIPPRTPIAQVAVELSLRACTLREQYPGARAQAPRQKEAHTERWPRPRLMDDGTLADANKAEAVLKVTDSWHVLVRLHFSRNFRSDKVEKWEARNNLQCLRTLSLACPQWAVLRNKFKTENSTGKVMCIRAKEFLLIAWQIKLRN